MVIVKMFRRVGWWMIWPFVMIYRGIWWTLRRIGAGIMSVVRVIIATPMAVIRAPVRLYRRSVVWRDWLIHKVEYLQSESQKWRTIFNIAKSPYTALRFMGLSPQMAAGLLITGSTVGTGVVVNETILSEPSFSAGDHGVYLANGTLDVPTEYSNENNTLKILMGTTIPIGEIVIEDVHVGTSFSGSTLPTGESHVIQIGGATTSAAWLEIGTLIIDRWRCSQFEMKNVNVHTLTVKQNHSDGQSISASPGVPRHRSVSGGNRAESAKTKGGYYDQIKIENAGATGGKIDRLVMRNLWTKGASCLVRNIDAGEITIQNSMFGRGDGLAIKDFKIGTSTVYKLFINEDNTEGTVTEVP